MHSRLYHLLMMHNELNPDDNFSVQFVETSVNVTLYSPSKGQHSLDDHNLDNLSSWSSLFV